MDKRTIVFMICVSLAFFGIQIAYNKYYGQEVTTVPQKKAPLVVQTEPVTLQKNSNETYYVLENDYQQLVFSNLGGSLVEINLPLKGKGSNSYVKEIDFDREIVASSPENARFPLQPYLTPDGGKQ